MTPHDAYPPAAATMTTTTMRASSSNSNSSGDSSIDSSTIPNSHHYDFALNDHRKQKRYQQPAGLVARLLWRAWIWTETSFALSLMEPWEIILIFSIVGITLMLVTVGLFRYFPHSFFLASQRAQYYLFGVNGGDELDKLALVRNATTHPSRLLDIEL